MATTLTYGFVRPTTGDVGSSFFGNLEDNITRTNDHDHNGTNSKKLTSASITARTGTLLAASWASEGNGTYSQTVSMPVGMSFDDYFLCFKNASGHQVFPTVEKVSSSSYEVFVNDNTLVLTVLYLS